MVRPRVLPRLEDETFSVVLNDEGGGGSFLFRSYEQLLQRVTDGDAELNSDTEKKLSEMERKLDDKEKEVKMVMNLYSGFNKLKTEVKVLKERASQASMKPALQGHKKDQTVEVGLAKILKRIQAYVAAPGMKKQNS